MYAEDGTRLTPPASGRSSPFSAHRSAEALESQNDEQIEGLRAKVQMLKNVSKSAFARST
jgi:blocked early in transport 1